LFGLIDLIEAFASFHGRRVWLSFVLIKNHIIMKSKITSTILVLTLSAGAVAFAQDKKEMKQLEKDYAAFTGHKKIYEADNWNMCKFTVVYKLTSAMTASSTDKNDYGAGKVKASASSGAYAILNGLSEEDLQKITDHVAQTFIERMKKEAGVDVRTWSTFKDNKHTDKIIEMAEEDREIYSRSQGLAYAVSYDESPHYNRIIVLVPNGKKLAKDLGGAVGEFTIVVDFAEMLAEAEAKVKYAGSSSSTVTYNLTETVDQKMYPGVRIAPNIGSQAALETGKNIQGTKINVHDDLGYMFTVGMTKDVISNLNFIESL
jgi:hypothetical protein